MGKYRILFENKRLISVKATEQETPAHDTFLEETTGNTVWATIEADSEQEAREKAQRLETELQTGQTKETLRSKENSPG
jgi:hypothetical protein